jgi:hypothetical protein
MTPNGFEQSATVEEYEPTSVWSIPCLRTLVVAQNYSMPLGCLLRNLDGIG